MITLLAVSIVMLAWYRLKDLKLDRDYTPYCYPAIYGTPYLEDGHVDIKPPLIHWSYKCALKPLSLLKLNTQATLRLLPFAGLSLACLLVGLNPTTTDQSTLVPITLALLMASPTLWVHMANTEWLTVTLWALALASPTPEWAALFLGLTPWANQKNVLLIVPVGLAVGLSLSPTILAAASLPSLVLGSYLLVTGRGKKALAWCWQIPKEFGRKRTFRVNVLSASRLIIPALVLLAPVIAMGKPNAWMLAAVVYALVTIASKQIVPHHFIGLAFLLALASEPNAFGLAALLIVWAFRDGLCLYEPKLVYPTTFGGPGGHYGQMLDDAEKITSILADKYMVGRAGNEGRTRIWVNGMENNVYLQAKCKATRIEIPELPGVPDKTPEFIVHCATSAKPFDYSDYEPQEISNFGLFTLMRRKRTPVKDFEHKGAAV